MHLKHHVVHVAQIISVIYDKTKDILNIFIRCNYRENRNYKEREKRKEEKEKRKIKKENYFFTDIFSSKI